VLLAIGYLVSGLLSRWFGKRLLPRLGMHESAAAALQSLASYALVATSTLFSLRLVNVPLTVFTFLGGAVAIGVGFGSQNIVNNFISGLILLAERPIRVGDLIEINGLCGTVEQIGARSTRVSTGANLEIIVPNSTFLQNNVINWTLSDDQVRTSVKVGVAYGSPTHEVARLLKQAADEHTLALREPEPLVLFTDFGDNALSFELFFWIKMRGQTARRGIESDVRHRVDVLFREAGIVFAYPQRDIHLDAARPISVRLLSADSPLNEQQPFRQAAA
jgi:small-conductance mechanosensitive channel